MRLAPSDRALERALLFNFAIHGLAILAMAALLLPALPGGVAGSDAERVATIASHPWRFRLGWLPWQLCAVADGWLAIAIVRTAWLPRVPAVLVLVLTLAAIVPDQYAQAVWVTRGVRLAGEAPVAYLALERALFPLTAGWGALLYTLAGLGWTWCFARAGTWSRLLGVLSVPLWATMLVAVASPLLPERTRPPPVFVAAANGLGFLLLQVWLGLLAEEVLRRARPFEAYGRLARWRYPGAGPRAAIADAIANSRLLGVLLERIPGLEMRSDLTDVLYVNYLVEADRLEPLVPPGLELQRLGDGHRYALFSFLTFRHGHFGPALLGPLRKHLSSPVQTNWRIHVRDPRTGHAGVAFVTNAITRLAPALVARLTTEGMPMHVLRHGSIVRGHDGTLYAWLDPGEGSAPDAKLLLRPVKPPELSGRWGEVWREFPELLAYCVPQEVALSSQPLRGRVTRQEIDVPIPLDACEPLDGSVISRAARAICGDAEPICFRVARVSFRFRRELHDRAA